MIIVDNCLSFVLRYDMAKKLMSFRADQDLIAFLQQFQKKNQGTNVTEIINASLHHFLSAGEKKQKKYLKKYKIRMFDEEHSGKKGADGE